jgi:hypothetical protein
MIAPVLFCEDIVNMSILPKMVSKVVQHHSRLKHRLREEYKAWEQINKSIINA